MKIRTQLVLSFCALVLFSFAVAGAVGILSARSVLFAVLSTQHKKQSAMLGTVSEYAIRHKDMPFLWRYMEHLGGFPGVSYSYLAGDSGYIWAHTDSRYINHFVDAWRNSSQASQALEHVVRVKAQGAQPATAHMGVDADFSGKLMPLVRGALLPPLLRYGGWALAASVVFGFALAFWLARPLGLLAEGARKVGEGDLSVELPALSGSEIGELAGDFNDMVRRLRDLDKMKDEFIASVSHDLRSPMSAIKMNVDYMLNHHPEKDKLSEEQVRLLHVITSNTMRLNVFVTNMLDAAKMKGGAMEFNAAPIRIPDVIKTMEELYGPSFLARKIRFSTNMEEELPPIYTDPERFDQAVSNLLSNALKFTPSGGEISIRAVREGPGIVLTVSDTGRGIAKKDLKKLFKRFAQVDVENQRKEKIQGTGLGLYIVKETLSAMGATIEIESEEGKGSRFILTLPALESSDAAHREKRPRTA